MEGAAFASLFSQVKAWAELRQDICCVVLVGSHARRDARADSDIDLVILADDQEGLLDDTGWVSQFGDVVSIAREDYDRVQSLRVVYASGAEVEFGITDTDWLALPLDVGTKQVIENGAVAISDPQGRLAKAAPSKH